MHLADIESFEWHLVSTLKYGFGDCLQTLKEQASAGTEEVRSRALFCLIQDVVHASFAIAIAVLVSWPWHLLLSMFPSLQ
eukprot:6181397-Pleurochrysis_carterae.AAC.1